MIDLRSDTVTKPSAGMLEAMFSAEVGDDVFGDDPTVRKLETIIAEKFGMEDSIFCASGTMTNQIAIKAQTFPGAEVICHKYSHIYLYEGGGVAQNSLASLKLLEGDRGLLTAQSIEEGINIINDIHQPVSTLVSLENTMNKGGGSIYDFNEILKIKDICVKNQLKLHLDGARLFNAIVETNQSPLDYGKVFDSISICLSKGLGAPVGSLLLGSTELIKKAKRIRKSFGGGWRQAGYLAAAGIYALENNISRLIDDHKKAKEISKILSNCEYVKNILPVDTNILIFELDDRYNPQLILQKLNEKGVKAVQFGPNQIRFVTHLDISWDSIGQLSEILPKLI